MNYPEFEAHFKRRSAGEELLAEVRKRVGTSGRFDHGTIPDQATIEKLYRQWLPDGYHNCLRGTEPVCGGATACGERCTAVYWREHSREVADMMGRLACLLGEDEKLWYVTGQVHDLDYLKGPHHDPAVGSTVAHPIAISRQLNDLGAPPVMVLAVLEHSPHMDLEPSSPLSLALIACDEHATMIANGVHPAYPADLPKELVDCLAKPPVKPAIRGFVRDDMWLRATSALRGLVKWPSSRAFRRLCDLVASDRLIFLTGAGISAGLRCEKNSARAIPGWLDLLRNLAQRRAVQPIAEAAKDAEADLQEEVGALLFEGAPGRFLIEAASLLRQGCDDFDHWLREEITPATVQPNVEQARMRRLHNALFATRPRGIMTFNYDDEHEKAILEHHLNWQIINPLSATGEEDMRRALADDLVKPFLLKAHGSVLSADPLVLTFEAYRNLLEKNPAYRAFVQHLLTGFRFVIIGFGLSDPDFDLFLNTMVGQFGSPLQSHIVIRRHEWVDRRQAGADGAFLRTSRLNRAEAQVLHRRFGIETLYVDEWGEISEVIEQAARTAGPELLATIQNCISKQIEVRRAAHRKLRQLGPAGKAVASAVLRRRIDVWSTGDVDELSELIYSLGKVDAHEKTVREENKEALLKAAETGLYVEPTAHALDQLDDLLEPHDRERLERLRGQLMNRPPVDSRTFDPDNRLGVYVERLILRLDAVSRAGAGTAVGAGYDSGVPSTSG